MEPAERFKIVLDLLYVWQNVNEADVTIWNRRKDRSHQTVNDTLCSTPWNFFIPSTFLGNAPRKVRCNIPYSCHNLDHKQKGEPRGSIASMLGGSPRLVLRRPSGKNAWNLFRANAQCSSVCTSCLANPWWSQDHGNAPASGMSKLPHDENTSFELAHHSHFFWGKWVTCPSTTDFLMHLHTNGELHAKWVYWNRRSLCNPKSVETKHFAQRLRSPSFKVSRKGVTSYATALTLTSSQFKNVDGCGAPVSHFTFSHVSNFPRVWARGILHQI